ncbi:trafficking PGA2 domain-containing protein [Fusarium pseudoanthophilum]|uniref:Trafficking PGA2 domain-containing protein n=1 Tax=Fusarium pseudoanthophilum TaxID=48495 RepID=A0A8H5NY92_9HYPO|nr:trafficking PGA2 domain-containing protein [Fusarium pseudoanthophilum]
MDPVAQQQRLQELNPLGKLTAQFLQYGANASNNISNAFDSMDTKAWLRLTVIVGGYMLLRPLFLKFVTKGAVQKMEDEDAREKRKAQISPNELRGLVEDEPEIDEEGDGTGADWGQKARVRQRTMLKDLLEAEERRREEEEDDKDIADLLED